MADQSDVERIALSLPGTTKNAGRYGFSVRNKPKPKGFVWVWLERVDPKKARVPNAGVIAIRVASQFDKELLLAADTEKFFTEPHYNGYPAVLVRLSAIGLAELDVVITAAWRCQAPKALVEEFDGAPKPPPKRRVTSTRASRSRPSRGRARSPSR